MQSQKVIFDCIGQDCTDQDWEALTKAIDSRLTGAGLPSLFSDAWVDVEGGCECEGTSEQVAAIRDVLSEFPVTITVN